MRIAIINLTRGTYSGGYIKYLKYMIPYLVNSNKVESIFCVLPKHDQIYLLLNGLEKIKFYFYHKLKFNYMFHQPDHMMLKALEEFAPDIIFLPLDRCIKYANVPTVNMVRNMEPFLPDLIGDSLSDRIKKFLQRIVSKSAIINADHTICVSDFVKDFVIHKFQVPATKLSKVYHGFSRLPLESLIKPNKIPINWANFIFTAGSIRPARGLEDIIIAISQLNSKGIKLNLVIAGECFDGNLNYLAKLKELIRHSSIEDQICWAGKLSEAEMGWCFKNSSIFIMTSKVEACPNIVLEAMGYGCISISTNSSPMPEFFRDCAEYYQPEDLLTLSSTIEMVLTWTIKKRQEVMNKALSLSLEFTWECCATQTISVLESVTNHKSV